MRVEVGVRHPLHAGPTGNAMLAFLDPEERERLLAESLEPLTPYTLIEPEQLRARLDEIAREGMGMSFRDHRMEASGVAAPVFGLDGTVCGAISLSGLAERFTPAVAREVAPNVRRVAIEVSLALGCKPRENWKAWLA
ncbi:HTH-type transcriptional repressor AllR (plasmid) [Arthrobacter sp. Hiyo8]|uniref:IclR family transcriptional regulator n=1 Tax=Arthrobacter sp. Hiyo1 TaxID=1588020 RepID=UPI0006838949|nr:IclR family transcriptional regulator C-terminal domain-containing protein [Arthrobacter sp. Hiyo1]BAS18469.1 HTH-type transcriptional repressor AllR [Arthrobacter sp. Hiyo8]GAP60783.1 HTH-type transcriptional repressor AllR [Arthrobacter sp. Hiyo1]